MILRAAVFPLSITIIQGVCIMNPRHHVLDRRLETAGFSWDVGAVCIAAFVLWG